MQLDNIDILMLKKTTDDTIDFNTNENEEEDRQENNDIMDQYFNHLGDSDNKDKKCKFILDIFDSGADDVLFNLLKDEYNLELKGILKSVICNIKKSLYEIINKPNLSFQNRELFKFMYVTRITI